MSEESYRQLIEGRITAQEYCDGVRVEVEAEKAAHRPAPGWLQRQFDAARRDVDAMPAWIRRAASRR